MTFIALKSFAHSSSVHSIFFNNNSNCFATGHPKVIAFVSHGGMLGTSEAASCGVPMVVMPFFGDQYGNGAMLEAAGMGIILNFEDVTGETLSKAIREVTSER